MWCILISCQLGDDASDDRRAARNRAAQAPSGLEGGAGYLPNAVRGFRGEGCLRVDGTVQLLLGSVVVVADQLAALAPTLAQ